MGRVNLVIAGGSTASGRDDNNRGGISGLWHTTMIERTAALCDRALHTKKGPIADFHLFAAHGRTLPYIVENLPGFLSGLEGSKTVGLFLVGGSDSRIPVTHESPLVDLEDFRNSFDLLGKLCCSHQVSPVFIEFPPIREPLSQGILAKIGSITNANLIGYNAVTQCYADQAGVPYIETWAAFGGAENAKQYTSADGIHLNTDGHQLLFDLTEEPVNRSIRQLIARP